LSHYGIASLIASRHRMATLEPLHAAQSPSGAPIMNRQARASALVRANKRASDLRALEHFRYFQKHLGQQALFINAQLFYRLPHPREQILFAQSFLTLGSARESAHAPE
jgi:hypothetical protein